MKHLILLYSLLAMTLGTPAFAQESETKSDEPTVNIEELSEGGVKFDISFDDDIDDDEKIKKVTRLLSEFDSELGQELETELSALSDEDKKRLVEKLDEGFTFDPNIDNFPIGVVFIALPAVILIFGMPLFLLIALLMAGYRKRRQKMELVDKYIAADRDIPEHVMTGLDNGGSASFLKSGLTLTAVGLGIAMFFNLVGASDVMGLGFIPMFLGIARLIFWYLVERKSDEKTES